MHDILINNCIIIDGSGNTPFKGSVLVNDGKITGIGDVEGDARLVVDAEGHIACPGFIDIHRHADMWMFNHPGSEVELRQGITTMISGNCGFAPAPFCHAREEEQRSYFEAVAGKMPENITWRTMEEYIKVVENIPLPINIGTLAGSGMARVAVKGFSSCELTAEELGEIKEALQQGLESGAFGISFGLMYVPESYYTTRELVEICSIAAEYKRPVTVHLRGEGSLLERSIEEMIKVTWHAGASLHISHFKSAGRSNWGKGLQKALALIDNARKRGQDITWDAYPYDAGSTSLITLLPPWAQEGGIDSIINRINTPALKEKIINELKEEHQDWDNLVCSTGWDRVMVSFSTVDGTIGRSIASLAEEARISPCEYALQMILKERGVTGIVFFHMSAEDVKKIISDKDTIIISDSLYQSGGNPHPRTYGAYARFISDYAGENGVISLQEAIRKATYLPAARLGICDRGLLKKGYFADIVVFDPKKIADRASYINPRQLPSGIEHVIVNGREALINGEIRSVSSGKFIKKTRK